MENFTKVVNIGKVKINNRFYNSFINIKFKEGCLSISGVEGPFKNGNCAGCAGQIIMGNFKNYTSFVDLEILKKVWDLYHLNNLQAGCIHQTQLKWNNDFVGEPCPTCGYNYGSRWLKIDVPVWALEFLKSLPESETEPAWI